MTVTSRKVFTTTGLIKRTEGHSVNPSRTVRLLPSNTCTPFLTFRDVIDGQIITPIPYARAFSQYFIGPQSAAGKMYPWLHQQAIQEGIRNLTQTAANDSTCPFM